MTSRTGYVWDALYGWADTGTGGLAPSSVADRLQPVAAHVAHPDTKRRLHELIATSGLLKRLTPIEAQLAQEEDILRVHDRAHYERILKESAWPKGGDAGDGGSPFGQGGHEIALLAAGGAIAATRAVVAGEVRNAYALVNPPGHHAERANGKGFCIFNNVAVAASYAREVLGVGRVAIVDWDVHHGNGAQDIFWSRSDVLNVSVHQDNCFPPASGPVDARGEGDGFGYTLNVPLPPGGGNAVYDYAFGEVVVPALRAFNPDLILIASGFDASIMDPLARMMVRSDGYERIAQHVLDAADELCDGRVVVVQEGGYSPYYVPFCGLKVLELMSGERTGIEDAYMPIVGGMGGDVLRDHEREAVDVAAALVADIS
ncbi:MAG: class II histone deacetylase [Microbacterium sp.]|uniref:class II histone deacetylase n=1 Tax=Microbacterium sp. TaxID=51671 RepID=UPI001D513696|nr:class II histone deacetylase [Microbacterium sp.]MBW8763285.1 class II histone deacetylase [Microbacterium sp.]